MPYIKRNWKGEVTGLFSVPQPSFATEKLPDDHPEVLAYRTDHPVPEHLLKPQTEEEIKHSQKEYERLEKEHKSLKSAIWIFNQTFSELEIALSAMLYQAINVQPKSSRVAYAIYFSPESFGARTAIVDNVVKQISDENPKLSRLCDLWGEVLKKISGPQGTRNKIAHGVPMTVAIRNRSHARLTAPAFDVIRVGRHIAKHHQPPGLKANDILKSAKKTRWCCERIDEINRLLAAHFEDGNPTLPEKFAELEAGLKTSDS